MTRWLRQGIQDARGFSLVELLVAIVIFVLLALAIDVVFATVNRSSRTAELAADVAQNGRVAIERLTREIRFATPDSQTCPPAEPANATMCIGEDGTWVAFKSARSLSNPRVFCLDVVGADPDDPLYKPDDCNYPEPFGGSYKPVWQAWIVYYHDPEGVEDVKRALRRRVQELETGEETPDPSGGDIIATSVLDFSVELSVGSVSLVTVTLDLEATEQVQGSNVPPQRITLTGTTYVRN